MNPDGREQRRLTREGDAEPGLAWSPDGRKIAFESFRGQGSQPSVWIMDSDGSDLHELHGSRRLSGPSWSPDGRTIALHGMWLVSVDGTRKTRLTRDGGWGPDWSRDFTIWVMDAGGSAQHRISPSPGVPRLEFGTHAAPEWSAG